MNESKPSASANGEWRETGEIKFAVVHLARDRSCSRCCCFSGWIIWSPRSRTNPPTTRSLTAHVVSVAPRIAGQVSAVHVLDNQMVRSNELLVEIDPADYSTTAAQKQSSADAAGSQLQGRARRARFDDRESDHRRGRPPTSRRPTPTRPEATDARAQADFQRSQELRKQNTISQQEFDAAQAAVKEADANLAAAKQKAIADASKINEAKAQLDATEAAVGMALAQFRQAQTNAQAAQLDLSYTKIFAPCDGRVTRKAVEPGNYVQTGQTLYVHRARRRSGSSPISRNRS